MMHYLEVRRVRQILTSLKGPVDLAHVPRSFEVLGPFTESCGRGRFRAIPGVNIFSVSPVDQWLQTPPQLPSPSNGFPKAFKTAGASVSLKLFRVPIHQSTWSVFV